MTHGEACADYDHSICQPAASFDVLAAECSDDNSNPEHYPISIHDVHEVVEVVPDHPEDKGLKPEGFKKNKRKKKKRKKNKNKSRGNCSQEIPIQSSLASGAGEELVSGAMFYKRRSVVEPVFENSVVLDPEVLNRVQESCGTSVVRQRNVNGRRVREDVFVEENSSNNSNSTKDSSMVQWGPVVSNGNKDKLEKELSLDWSKVMEKHHGVLGGTSPTERLPFRYFMGEIYNGNTLRSTISVGNERKRQGVYNTMFYVPLKCERLILAGFLVCLDSFLSLLTITPARILLSLWRALDIRQFQRPDATELSDFGCFVILACGVVTLQSTDISLIYHIIRGQGTIKLYVVYNVLEIFDKLLQSFGEDVLQVLFSSADGLATCSAHELPLILLRFFLDQTIAAVAFVVHSFILLAQAITLSTCIIAHNNALMALLVSNNFAEIKSNVFKKVSKDNLHSVVYYDIIERFHITAFVIFVLAQNILEAEESWFGSFVDNALLVFICEVIIDTIKHAFLAKFNEIKPEAYSDFLEDLCKQVLNMQPDEDRKNLNFIPLAPACVVIRVLTPIYASLLPHGPLGWRWFWIAFWSILTFVILAVCKTLVGLTLNRLATWYINQRLASKQHVD